MGGSGSSHGYLIFIFPGSSAALSLSPCCLTRSSLLPPQPCLFLPHASSSSPPLSSPSMSCLRLSPHYPCLHSWSSLCFCLLLFPFFCLLHFLFPFSPPVLSISPSSCLPPSMLLQGGGAFRGLPPSWPGCCSSSRPSKQLRVVNGRRHHQPSLFQAADW